MELGNKLAFGVSAVMNGQKTAVVNAEPELVAKTTVGGFSINPSASKIMSICPSEHIMFLNNIDNIEAAISNGDATIAEYATAQGYELDDNGRMTNVVEIKSVINAFAQWFIAKGIARRKPNGDNVMARIRMTDVDKQRIIDTKGSELIADADFRAAICKRYELDIETATDEEILAKLSPADIASPETIAYQGSKCATTSSKTGIGCQLNFSDTSTWETLKSDLEDKTSVNRVYSIDVENALTIKLFNGFEQVDVKVYPIIHKSDEEPTRRNNVNKD